MPEHPSPPPPDGVDVRGGAVPVRVDADHLRARAEALGHLDADLLRLVPAVVALGVDPDLAVAAFLDPVGAARVHAQVVRAAAGQDGLLTVAGHLAVVVTSLRAAAVAYDLADASARDVLDWVWGHVAASVTTHLVRGAVAATGALGGGVLGPVAAAGAVTTAVVAAAWVWFRTWPVVVAVAADAAGDAVRGDLQADSLDERLAVGALEVTAALGGDAAAVGTVALEWVVRHPWAAEQLATTPFDVLTAVAPLPRVGWDLSTRVTGLPPAPDDAADLAAWLVVGLTVTGTRGEGPVSTRAVSSTVVRGPAGVGGLFARLGPLTGPHPGHQPGAYGGGYTPSTVVVERTTSRSGAVGWAVYVPPTQSWGLGGRANPFDATSNLVGFSGARADAGDAVLAVLRATEVPPDEPVLLVGYSQGGITATQLASDAAVRAEFDLAVLTVGSPVALADVPADVQVLSVQHEQDLVTLLDGEQNPARPGWTTVTRDLLDPTTGDGDVALGLAAQPWMAHHYAPYAETARMVDASADPALAGWRAAAAPSFASPGSVTTQTRWEVSRAPGPES